METWNMGAVDWRRLNVMEMRYLKSICGITQMDCMRNEKVQQRTRVARQLAG